MFFKIFYDKIWDVYVVYEVEDGICLFYIDCYLVYEVISLQVFEGLCMVGCKVCVLEKIIVVLDYNVLIMLDCIEGIDNEESCIQVEVLDKNVKEFGVYYYLVFDVCQGIVYIVGFE